MHASIPRSTQSPSVPAFNIGLNVFVEFQPLYAPVNGFQDDDIVMALMHLRLCL